MQLPEGLEDSPFNVNFAKNYSISLGKLHFNQCGKRIEISLNYFCTRKIIKMPITGEKSNFTADQIEINDPLCLCRTGRQKMESL